MKTLLALLVLAFSCSSMATEAWQKDDEITFSKLVKLESKSGNNRYASGTYGLTGVPPRESKIGEVVSALSLALGEGEVDMKEDHCVVELRSPKCLAGEKCDNISGAASYKIKSISNRIVDGKKTDVPYQVHLVSENKDHSVTLNCRGWDEFNALLKRLGAKRESTQTASVKPPVAPDSPASGKSQAVD